MLETFADCVSSPFQPPSHQTIGKLRLLRADANRYQMIETAEDRIARIPRDDGVLHSSLLR